MPGPFVVLSDIGLFLALITGRVNEADNDVPRSCPGCWKT
jgi:hypothetical protein